ncbi:uncharacterized protein LOC106079809 [Biomphalaria glabrata]|uniref:Uncharacterized protein LOC106079809 n=2 Tax=Biomphalaria glabrata TaxID=6526 RepID=A0A9W2YJP3_BIOGL|nr:uncharacterized protein LOC106079809 [Biomphalaria glabrata]
MDCCFTLLTTAMIVTLVSASPVAKGHVAPTDHTCGIKDYNGIKERLLMNADVFDSLYRLHTFAAASAILTYNRTADIYTCGTDCKKRKENLPHGGETCPSVAVENVDKNRVPCVMEEVRCACQTCKFPKDFGENKTYTCRPIYHYVPVMRGDHTLPKERWTQYLEPLIVGCKCVPHAQEGTKQKPDKCLVTKKPKCPKGCKTQGGKCTNCRRSKKQTKETKSTQRG